MLSIIIVIFLSIIFIFKTYKDNSENQYMWKGNKVECEYCKENAELVKVSSNGKIFYMYIRKENDYISSIIRKQGDWSDCKTIKKLWYSLPGLRIEDYYMDAGANIGICSLDMLNLGIKTIAIEPIPNNLHLFTKSILYNYKYIKNITLFKVALSNKNAVQTINIEKGNWGGSSLIDLHQNYKTKKINVLKLDVLLNNFNKKIHLASVDIQGYELFMLEGGIEILKRKTIRHFYMEIWCLAYKKIKISEVDVYNLFEKYNYTIKNKIKCTPKINFFNIIASLY